MMNKRTRPVQRYKNKYPCLGVIIRCACCTHLNILKFTQAFTKTSHFKDYSCNRHIFDSCSGTYYVIMRVEFQSYYYHFILRLNISFWVSTSYIINDNYIGRSNGTLYPCFPSKDIRNGFQPKTSPFSTRHPIWVNYKILIQLSQPISLLFTYLIGYGTI